MVLESIIDPFVAKKHPFWLFLMGVLFAVISLFFGLWIFKEQVGMVMVFLTVILTVPLMYATLEEEEEEDWNVDNEETILKEHSKAIIFLSALFVGFVVGFTLLYVFLPSNTVEQVFSAQLQTINNINSNPSTGNTYGLDFVFFKILTNNIKVMLFSIFFAFFFGAGAIFILSWNASVIAAAIGSFIKTRLMTSDFSGGVYLNLFTVGIMRYMTHGIFEIVGYFIGALAGGIISMGIIKHGMKSSRFKNIIYDALVLVLIASVFLIVGAIVEVYVTPKLFN